ncbi:MAG: 50S ribosomal protein L2 [Candidatus Bathyarchaeia archaeon]
MGKRIRVQRRGRGGPTFRAATHKRVAPSLYPPLTKDPSGSLTKGVVEELTHDPGRGAPLALLRFENGESCYVVAAEGLHVGQQIQMGEKAQVDVGNIIPLGSIPEGTMVCNVELKPGDGGKLAKSSGAYVTVVAHTGQGTLMKLSFGKTRYLSDDCRATIGVVSGAGRTEKPFLKAGAKFHLMRARGRKYPRTRGRAMVAAVHPYGSSKRSARKVTTVSRNAPPGQKVGLIAARAAGRKKKKVTEDKLE